MSSNVLRRARPRDGAARLTEWLRRLESPTTTYYLLVAVTAALVTIGLVMVLSASSVVSLKDTGSSSAFQVFGSQAQFALIGGLALLAATRVPVAWWKRLALPGLVGALALQALVFVPSIGVSVNGNANWIKVGPVTVQPSELIKLGLVLVGALVLSAKRKQLGRFSHIVVPFLVPAALLSVVLVLLGHDLGTVIILCAVIGGVLFAAGVPGRYFVGAVSAAALMAFVMVTTSTNRLGRFDVWLGKDTNPFGPARQPIHGRYALADGGWFGLGLGASREKWSWLSEPHNDFIFAIIGEELGLPGTLLILALFGVLAFTCYRLVLRTTDNFVRIATAGVMSWLVIQAMVNIGSVIGLLPVIGVPLPLVSSGGSSLVTTLFALGMLMSFARAEPGCREALAARPSVVRRGLAVLPSRRARGRR